MSDEGGQSNRSRRSIGDAARERMSIRRALAGELVSLALFEKYEEEGPSFLSRLIRLLERGGSGSPGNLIKDLGVDIQRPDFWEKGFQVIRRLIDELKSLGPWDKICTDQNL